jgi:uncharacterized OsmC-like protein
MSTLEIGRRRSLVAEQQAPLRSRYASHPDEAITTKWAKTTSADGGADDPFHVYVEIGREHTLSLLLGLDLKVGGLGDLPNPGDLLCAALAACEDATIRMLADLLGITLEAIEVEVRGTVDLRGTLAIDQSARVGFQGFTSIARLRAAADTPPRLIERLVEATKRACVNLETLERGVPIEVVVTSA